MLKKEARESFLCLSNKRKSRVTQGEMEKVEEEEGEEEETV